MHGRAVIGQWTWGFGLWVLDSGLWLCRQGSTLVEPLGTRIAPTRACENVQVVARYIIENPVRAGLVKSALDYPFVGSQVYELKDLLASLPEPVAQRKAEHCWQRSLN